MEVDEKVKLWTRVGVKKVSASDVFTSEVMNSVKVEFNFLNKFIVMGSYFNKNSLEMNCEHVSLSGVLT